MIDTWPSPLQMFMKFFIEPLSERQTMETLVLERLPKRYASTTDSAALLGMGTAVMLEINKSIHVSVYLLPLHVVGSLSMVSIAMHAKGNFGISKCSWVWHAVLGRFLEQVIQLLIWFLTSNLMPFHQNLHFSMLNVLADPWCPLQLWNLWSRVYIKGVGMTTV